MKRTLLLTGLFLLGAAHAVSSELDGFTRVTTTRVNGEFEGADFDKVVQLENGMVFKFNTYKYSYAYRPEAAVYKRTFSIAELKKMKIKNPTAPVTLYKLLIQDEVYAVYRIK